MTQLNIDFQKDLILEVIFITPTKEMPLEIFKHCYKFSYFSELMEHPTENTVKYDPDVTSICAEGMDEVLYQMVQDNMLEMSFCVPKEWFADILEEE